MKNKKMKNNTKQIQNFRKIFLVIFLLIFLNSIAFSSDALIRGTVTDSKTNEPLGGVNIMLKGTYYGGATDLNGEFIIDGISSGNYDISVRMIGYTEKVYSGIKLKSGERKKFDIHLEPTVLALGQEITVVGEKPIIDAESTSSSIKISSKDLKNKMVESVTDVVAQQVGVTKSNNEIHIRGGRVDEGQFIVDGLSIKDPLTGSTSNLYVNSNAIEELEFITGGFNAEYGQAMSGIIDVKLKSGTDKLEASARYKTDKLFGNNFNTDNLEFTLGAPIIRKSSNSKLGQISFFTSGYVYFTDTYLPVGSELSPYRDWMNIFTKRADNDFSYMAKLNWNITAKQKFAISYNHSANVDQGYFDYWQHSSGYPYAYQNILNNYFTTTHESQVVNIIWTHTINQRFFYNLNFGYFYTGVHRSVQNKHWTEYDETLDLAPTEYSALDESGRIRVYSGDKFWDYGDAPYWYDYYSKNYSTEGDFTYLPNTRHTVKTGFTHRYTVLQMMDIYKPWLGNSGFGESYDFYKVHPSDGSFYLQDKITFEGMIVNIGARYDYWFIGKYATDAINNPEVLTITEAGREKYIDETFEIFGAKGKGHLSPRIGISHPVTDNDVLYFNYGHFSQLPTYQYVYAKLNTVSEATYQLIGNPNLNPKTTVSYELGIKHKFSASQALEFKAYYKDMFDYETSQSITTYNPLIGRYSLMMYINMDYARSRGIEIIYRKLYGKYFSGDITYSYSIGTGKSSTPNDNLLVEAGKLSAKPITENYLSWDNPHNFATNLRFYMDQKTQPRLFGIPIPNHWQVSARIVYGSGKRYTESVATDTITEADGSQYYIGYSRSDEPYSEISDSYFKTDVKITKRYKISGWNFSVFLDMRNIFNFESPRRINPFTGDGYNPGEIIKYSYANGINPNYDPSRFYSPRNIILGISIRL